MKNFLQSLWFFNYDRSLIRFDVIAGLTTAAVVIPKAMAFAVIAGLPIETGLYTAFVPLLIYGFLGNSRYLSVSSITVLAIVTQVEVAQIPPGMGSGDPVAAAATLAFLAGVVLVAAAFLRLGFLGYFISTSVLTGFKLGIGIVIIIDQFPKLLGIHISKTGFFRDIGNILLQIPHTHLLTLSVGFGVIVLMLLLKHFLPKVPTALAGIAAAIAVSALFGLNESGVACVGTVRPGLPSFALPEFPLLRHLLPGALGVALLSFIESAAAGKAFLHPSERAPNLNRELLATGTANLCGGFFQIFPAAGGITQSAVNAQAGARSQAAGLVTSLLTLLTMLVLAPVLKFIPLTALAGVVFYVSLPLLDLKKFYTIFNIRRTEFLWALVAVAGVIFFGIMNGVLIAVAVSLLTLVYQATHPPVYELGRKSGTNVFRPLDRKINPDDVVYPGLLMLRVEGRLNFASIPYALDRIRESTLQHSARVVLLDLSAVPDIEYTALEMMDQAETRLRKQNIELWLCALNPEALTVVRRSPLGQRLGRERMLFTIERAVEKYTAAA